MPWTGSGTFQRTDGTRTGGIVWGDARDATVKVLANDHDFHDQDVADGLENCLTIDGQTIPTAPINWGGQELQNLGHIYLESNRVVLDSDDDSYLQSTGDDILDFFVGGIRFGRFQHDGSTAKFEIRDTDAGAATAPAIGTYRDSASPAVADLIGSLRFDGNDSGGNQTSFAKIIGSILVPTDAAEDGELQFHTMVSGALTELARFTPSALVIGKTLRDDGATKGIELLTSGRGNFTNDGGVPLQVNRLSSDGTLVTLSQAGSAEGLITVSGTTVAYTTFTGGHWSQFADPNQADPPEGTLLSTIDQPWERDLVIGPKGQKRRRNRREQPGEGELVLAAGKPQLVKCKITDQHADPRVYGTFGGRDPETGDIHVYALGTVVVRVIGPATGGDLIQASSTPGVAERQPTDFVRSATLGKLSAGDGRTDERLLPCVLYSG